MLGGGWPAFPGCYYDMMDPCTVDVPDGEAVGGVNFGGERPSQAESFGSIAGAAWREASIDGERRLTEPGVANVEVRLSCCGCSQGAGPSFTTTDAQGNYVFGSLPSAIYVVEVDKSFPASQGILTSGGWMRPPVPASSATIQIMLSGGEDRDGVDFGWGFLSVVRPPFYLRATLQVFQVLPTLSIYRSPTPRLFQMPTDTPRRIIILPTATPVSLQPLPTKPPLRPKPLVPTL